MGKKKISIANFNVVFIDGQEEKPLLDYFGSILMPAMMSKSIRKAKDSSYRLMNVGVKEVSKNFILYGVIVKTTVLEVKSDLDELGNLVEKDERIPTAPYSTFVIYLKNHRMIFAENQKGSPDLRSFRSTVKYLLDEYVREQISLLKDKDKYPIPIINVIGIPAKQKLSDTLKEVKRINKLTLRFYPLNGDLDFAGMLDVIATDFRKMVGSKNGEIVYKSPGNISGVIEIVEKAEGTIEPIFNVQYEGKKKVTIRNDQISERMEMEIIGETVEKEVNNMVDSGKEISSLHYLSSGNQEAYEKNQGQIIRFCKR